jgi:hypothetical protein
LKLKIKKNTCVVGQINDQIIYIITHRMLTYKIQGRSVYTENEGDMFLMASEPRGPQSKIKLHCEICPFGFCPRSNYKKNSNASEAGFCFHHQEKKDRKTYLLCPLAEAVSNPDGNNIKMPGIRPADNGNPQSFAIKKRF